MSSVRQRRPEAEPADGQESEVLDEQAQERVLQRLRNYDEDSKKFNALMSQLILSFSVLLQALHFVTKSNPLNTIFPPDDPRLPPYKSLSFIALSALYIILHITSFLSFAFPKANAYLPSTTVTSLLTTIGPIYSLIQGNRWQDVLWWTLTAAVLYIFCLVRNQMGEGEAEIQQVENLRYDSKSA